MDYAFLNPESRAEIVRQRILQMEQEHYQRELDKKIAEGMPGGAGQQMLADAAQAQAMIEAAIRVARAELAELEGTK